MDSLSVTELNQYIKALMEGDPALKNVLVLGETSNYKVYPSGHHYFTLKDGESALRCVMFKGAADKLGFRPKDGMKVLAAGKVSVFPRDGAYQLYVSHMTPDGLGALTQAYEELKQRLGEEGLFDPAHKKPLPAFPMRVCLVTSGAGAAVWDMIRIFRRRWPICELLVTPVRVQGTEAPEEIARMIRYINKFLPCDVIITGRGGGSLEDLWAFNDERVARAIFASHIPVVSAVGHEPDVLISDLVADVRASTPSHAAELVSPDQRELLAAVRHIGARLPLIQGRRMEQLSQQLEQAKLRLRSPERVLQDKRQHLDNLGERLTLAATARKDQGRQRLGLLCGKLEAMSPLRVLSRGYSLATAEDGTVITKANQVKAGDALCLRPAKGQVFCRVESVKS